MSLALYIERENFFRLCRSAQLLISPLSKDDCKDIFKGLSDELSSDSLNFNGEISNERIMQRMDFLSSAWVSLEAIYGGVVSEEDIDLWFPLDRLSGDLEGFYATR